ncbi:ankyrin repeat domain-containing protein [Stenotrophomonas sp. GD03819]|uniref:ankyrin repeat domain-containing protein n=1 Tax=Stenotrophomonas sp. GD03819 TaxID=2975384 RepID=UPI00244C0B1B|nr:ankyrin repeat domain-containing protein [Stenotrophomonas sp. GD03819]MDH1791494.1 ankyrin repeat domain-containing protein [Stenotrophomonas sp. GD03819]
MDPRERFEELKSKNYLLDDSVLHEMAGIIQDMSVEERANNIDVVRDILKIGKSDYERSLVFFYLQGSILAQEKPEVVEMMLEEAKDQIDIDKEFFISSEHHNIPAMKILYKHGCSIDGLGEMSDTALHYAARTSDHEMAKILIDEFGFDPLLKNKEGRTPYDIAMDVDLFDAARSGDLDKVKELMDEGYPTRAAVNQYRNADEYCPVYGMSLSNFTHPEPAWKAALDNGHEEAFWALIDAAGYNDHFSDKDGWKQSALSYAISSGKDDVAIELIARGADMHTQCGEFHKAVQRKDSTLAGKMIEMGADVNAPVTLEQYDCDINGCTPLHCAGSRSQVEQLVKWGANVNAVMSVPNNFSEYNYECDGFTPLHNAETPDVALALLEAGADHTLKAGKGGCIPCTALETIKTRGESEVAEAMESFIQKEMLFSELKASQCHVEEVAQRMKRRM